MMSLSNHLSRGGEFGVPLTPFDKLRVDSAPKMSQESYTSNNQETPGHATTGHCNPFKLG